MIAIKRSLVLRSVNCPTTATSTLLVTLLTPRMRVASSSTSSVRRSLTNSLKQCNLHLQTRLLSILSISGQGADFKLKIRKVDGYWNYDKSEFASPSIFGGFDDDRLESIWKQGYSSQSLKILRTSSPTSNCRHV